MERKIITKRLVIITAAALLAAFSAEACAALTKKGAVCKNPASAGSIYCHLHGGGSGGGGGGVRPQSTGWSEIQDFTPPKPAATRPEASQCLTGTVSRVVDGDTFVLSVRHSGGGASSVTVRLWGIDAPERLQPYYEQSSAKLKELTDGKTVIVRDHGKEKYGRTIGSATAEGTDINAEMVRSGMAWHYYTTASDARDLSDAQYKAKTAKRGLWAAEQTPIEPWKWRDHLDSIGRKK